jgi:hypothetical protein
MKNIEYFDAALLTTFVSFVLFAFIGEITPYKEKHIPLIFLVFIIFLSFIKIMIEGFTFKTTIKHFFLLTTTLLNIPFYVCYITIEETIWRIVFLIIISVILSLMEAIVINDILSEYLKSIMPNNKEPSSIILLFDSSNFEPNKNNVYVIIRKNFEIVLFTIVGKQLRIYFEDESTIQISTKNKEDVIIYAEYIKNTPTPLLKNI